MMADTSGVAKDPLAARRLLQLWTAIVILAVAVGVLGLQLRTERHKIDNLCNDIAGIVPHISGLNGAYGC